MGHTIDRCYKKHGFPLGFNKGKMHSFVNQTMMYQGQGGTSDREEFNTMVSNPHLMPNQSMHMQSFGSFSGSMCTPGAQSPGQVTAPGCTPE